MQDKKLIDIACIKNITGIRCSKIDVNENGLDKCLSVSIVYDNKKTMKMSYKNKYFLDFLKKIKQVYNIEKANGNISFLNDLAKEVIENYEIQDIPSEPTTSHNFYPLNSLDFLANMRKDYIVQLLELVLKLFYSDQKIIIKDIKGYKTRYKAIYEVDGKDYQIPFQCVMNDKYNFSFAVNGIKNNGVTFKGGLKIRDKYILLNWCDKKEELTGKIVCDFNNGFNEYVISIDGGVTFIEQLDNKINSSDMDLINSYLKILNLNQFDHGMQINNNNYYMTNSKIEDNIETKYMCHFTNTDGIVSILYKTISGHLKDDNSLFVPFKTTRYCFNIVKLNNNKYLIQKEYIDDGLYSYGIYENNNFTNINVDDFYSINDVKKFCKRGITK